MMRVRRLMNGLVMVSSLGDTEIEHLLTCGRSVVALVVVRLVVFVSSTSSSMMRISPSFMFNFGFHFMMRLLVIIHFFSEATSHQKNGNDYAQGTLYTYKRRISYR